MWLLLAIIALLVFYLWYTYPAFGRLLYSVNQVIGMTQANLKRPPYTTEGLAYVDNCYKAAAGSRPVLVLIHGFGADKSVWYPLAKHFTKKYRLIIPDLLGHGESQGTAISEYSVAAQAEHLAALIRRQGETQVHLVGNSMGGHIAAYMSVHFPSLVSSVTLICPAGLRSPVPSLLEKQLASGNNPFLITERAQFYPFYDMTMARPPYTPTVVKDALADQYIRNRTHLAIVFSQYSKSPLLNVDELAGLDCPVCIIWGEKDNMVDVSAAALWHRATNGMLKILADVGHMPMLEAPKSTSNVLQRFYKTMD